MCLKKWIKKMAVLDHFLFNSDYPADKLVFMQEGSITPTATWTRQYAFYNTHIKTQIYFEGDYTVQGSSDVYPITTSAQFGDVFVLLASFMYNGECWVTVATITTASAALNKKVSFRIWGVYGESEAKNTDIGQTSNAAKPKLSLTSDNEYPRFLGDGNVTPGQEYEHKLGFVPMIKAWGKFNGNFPITQGTTANVDYYAPVGTEMHFGYPSASWVGRSTIIQATKNKINTYSEPSGSTYDNPSTIYFRMYTI